MQIHFKGQTYHLAVGNLTFPIPGDKVSSRGLGRLARGIHLTTFPMSSLMSVPPDPQQYAPELVPALRHLLHPHRHQRWLRGPVLCVLKVHQTEIKSRLVIDARLLPGGEGLEQTFPGTPFRPRAPAGYKEDCEHSCSATSGHGAAVAQAGHRMAAE